MDCSLPDSSVHRIFQARILEWVTVSFSRRSSPPRDQTRVSRIVERHFTIWATRGGMPIHHFPLHPYYFSFVFLHELCCEWLPNALIFLTWAVRAAIASARSSAFWKQWQEQTFESPVVRKSFMLETWTLNRLPEVEHHGPAYATLLNASLAVTKQTCCAQSFLWVSLVAAPALLSASLLSTTLMTLVGMWEIWDRGSPSNFSSTVPLKLPAPSIAKVKREDRSLLSHAQNPS